MTMQTAMQPIENMIEAILANEPEYFLVDLKVKPTNNIKVFLDGEAGISIEKCTAFN